MLVFLVLCAYLRTLQGAPLPLQHASSSVITVDRIARDTPAAPDCGGTQFRTVNSILQSCLLTIFVCVWTSAHPNINGPRDSGWTCLKRKVVTMLCAVIAPEMVLYWALVQRSAAKEIAEKYNKEFAITGVTKTSLWRGVMGWFKRLPKATTRRGGRQSWTTTHGFFIQMGGFILYENEYPKTVLDYELLAELLRNKRIDAPTMTERELQDRSKGDTISKTIVVLQTMWFVFQCSARWGQGLPLSELEVLTFAFAVVNVAIYAAWWEKLQDVDMAICVPLKKVEKEKGEVQHVSYPEPASLSLRHSKDDLFLSLAHENEPNDSAGEKQCWMRRMVRKDREGSLFFPLFLPYRIFGSLIRLLVKMGDVKFGGIIQENDLRVPMFYTSSWHGNHPKQALCVVGTIFGAIHLIAWESKSTSLDELVLWRASAILLTIVPSLTLLGWTASTLGMEAIADSVFWILLLLVPGYIASRFILVIVAILAILHPSPGVLLDISWTLYVPHF